MYKAVRYRLMVMHSPTPEEGNSIPLALMLRQLIDLHASPPLAFDLMLRVHVNNGFAFYQNHGLDYVEIQQFRRRHNLA